LILALQEGSQYHAVAVYGTMVWPWC